MFIVWGSRMCGKVDAVPGLCHVITNFGHLYYFPLIPTGSILVLAEDSDGTYGLKIPLSLKSILVAWLRAFLWVSLIPAALVLILSFDHRGHGVDWKSILVSLISPVLLVLSYRIPFFSRATIERATQFAEHEDMPDEIRRHLIEQIKQMYIARGDVLTDDHQD